MSDSLSYAVALKTKSRSKPGITLILVETKVSAKLMTMNLIIGKIKIADVSDFKFNPWEKLRP